MEIANSSSNVDRLYAIWQRLNPDEITFQQDLSETTFTEPRWYRQDQTSPLLPFLRINNPDIPRAIKFWTTADVLNVNIFGYSYAELDLTLPQLNAHINTRYGWLTPGVEEMRPPPRIKTGFPVDFGENHVYAKSLPCRVLIDGDTPFPSPYIREVGYVRALRSIEPEFSGVHEAERRTADVPCDDFEEVVSDTAFAAVINTNSILLWDAFVQFEKFVTQASS